MKMPEKYCFHCEVMAILERNLRDGVCDLEEALHNVAQVLGEIIKQCPRTSTLGQHQ